LSSRRRICAKYNQHAEHNDTELSNRRARIAARTIYWAHADKTSEIRSATFLMHGRRVSVPCKLNEAVVTGGMSRGT
jgi:hypothetical protein